MIFVSGRQGLSRNQLVIESGSNFGQFLLCLSWLEGKKLREKLRYGKGQGAPAISNRKRVLPVLML